MNTPTTAQQIFDTVVRHAWAMPRQSSALKGGGSRPECLYRSPDGNACFVGVFLTPEQARLGDSLVGGISACGLEERGALPPELAEHTPLLSKLQTIHDADINWQGKDRPADKSQMTAAFRTLAAEFGLSTAVLDDPKPLPESLTSLLHTPAPTHEPAL